MIGRARLLGWVAAAALLSGCDATGLPAGADGAPDGLPETLAETTAETTPENGPLEATEAAAVPGPGPIRVVMAPDGQPSTVNRQPSPDVEYAQNGHGPAIEKGEPLRPAPVVLADGSVRPASTVVTCLLVTWGADPDGLPIEAHP